MTNDELIATANALRAQNRKNREIFRKMRETDANTLATIKSLQSPIGRKFPTRYKAG